MCLMLNLFLKCAFVKTNLLLYELLLPVIAKRLYHESRLEAVTLGEGTEVLSSSGMCR